MNYVLADPWNILKWSVTVVFIIFLIRIITSEALVGPLTADASFLIMFVLAMVFIIATVPKMRLSKLFGASKSHDEYIKAEILCSQKGQIRIPGAVGADGEVLEYPNWDISMNIGDHHYLRFKDKATQTTRNIFYDAGNNVIRGEIKGTKLNYDPETALKSATLILESCKAGVSPKKVITPELIEKVIEREKPPEEKKEKGTEAET